MSNIKILSLYLAENASDHFAIFHNGTQNLESWEQ